MKKNLLLFIHQTLISKGLKPYLLVLFYIVFSISLFAQSNSSASFTLNAPATASNIQWYKDGVAIAGQTAMSYEATMPGVYWVAYDDTCPGLTSAYTIIIENNASSTTTLQGPPAASNYQWIKNGVNLNGQTTANYDLATDTSAVGTYLLSFDNGICTQTFGDIAVYVLIPPCDAGSAAPALATTTFSNLCPATTVDLSGQTAANIPAGSNVLEWHSVAAPTDNTSLIADVSMLGAGTYYAVFHDTANNCYSSASTPVTITTNTCIEPPMGINDIAITNQGEAVSANVLINDNDPQNLPLTLNQTPLSGPSQGSVVLNIDGTYTYTPDPSAIGEDEFCYELMNSFGFTDEACVTIEIIPSENPTTNDPPIAVNDNVETSVDTPVTIAALANDLDPDGNETLVSPTLTGAAANGIVLVNPDGTFSYTSNPGFIGEDTFTYQVCDNASPALCDDATVTIYIQDHPAGNKPPVAVDDAALTMVDVAVAATVADNDYDLDNNTPLIFTVVEQPTSGSLNFLSDGSFDYTPNSSYVGNDYFIYSVCDNANPMLCDTATAMITIEEARLTLNVKVLLEGALWPPGNPSALMRDDLRAQGLIPLQQPYSVAVGDRFEHVQGGNEQTTAAVLNANAATPDAIVDWVFIELRDAIDNTNVIKTISALVQADGDVVAADGQAIELYGLTAPFYLSVKHRNHLGVMTAHTVTAIDREILVDFTTMNNSDLWNHLGYNGYEMITLADGRKALWAGNAKADAKVKYDGSANDRNQILVDMSTYYSQHIEPSFLFPLNYDFAIGYFMGDINMDGKVKYDGTNNDRVVIQAIVVGLYGLNTEYSNNFNNLIEQIPSP